MKCGRQSAALNTTISGYQCFSFGVEKSDARTGGRLNIANKALTVRSDWHYEKTLPRLRVRFAVV